MSIILLLSLLALAFGRLEIRNMDLPHVPDSYIITYHTNTTHEEAARHWALMDSRVDTIKHKYAAGSHTGFSAIITDQSVLDTLLEDPLVLAVEANGFAYAIQEHDCKHLQEETPSWGLTRLSHKGSVENGVKGQYRYSTTHTGKGVSVYVIDTGIQVTHTDFQGRAKWGVAYAGGEEVDGNGHGTHCAGTVGGHHFGVAKEAELIAVKVLSAGGGGTWEDVIAGVDYVTKNAVRGKCVASMSLGGSGSNIGLTNAINALYNFGCVVVVAAGNSNADACRYTPSGIPATICVGSSEIAGFFPEEFDGRSSFSNWGTCLDVFAPGRDITSTWIGADDATNTISGTSMACPHVAGFAAGILSAANPDVYVSPEEVLAEIQKLSQKDLIVDAGTGSVNLLLHNECQS